MAHHTMYENNSNAHYLKESQQKSENIRKPQLYLRESQRTLQELSVVLRDASNNSTVQRLHDVL